MELYYYDIRDKYVKKYEVEINKENLKTLRKNIIDDCSIINYEEYKTTKEPDLFDEHIRNYRSKKIGKITYNDFLSQDEDEYLVSYNYYNFSVLVSIIDSLLNDNTSIISILNDPDLLTKSIDDEKIKSDIKLKEEIKILIDKGLYDEIDILVQNKIADEILKNQERLILEKKYLNLIKQSINLYFREKISLKELENIKYFFKDIDTKNNTSSNLVKILKKD